MRILYACCILGIASCVTDSGRSTSSLSDGTIVHTIRCDNSWDGCYLAANKVCGDDGFDEVARHVDTTLESAGRLERMHTVEGGIEQHRYSENARKESYNRVITIRCRPPR